MIGVGSVLAGRYELRERVGAGGMGEVYRALDRLLEREVAIKSLLPELAREEELVSRFRREAQALARVRHPGIIAVHDLLGLDDGRLCLVLELVPGRSLEQELQGGPLGWLRCADIGAQVCGALAAAHAREVVHRDIKPSNILIEPSGVVRVADFGIARLAGAGRVTRSGVSVGTPGFWAPEQALGESSGPPADLYSLGAVLFVAATGRLPFPVDDENPAAAFANVTRPVPDPREAAPGLPDAAAELIMRAMAREPADRPASALEMARALRASAGLPMSPVTPVETVVPRELLTGEGAPGGPAAASPAAGPRDAADDRPARPARRRAAAIAAGIALVAAAAAGGFASGGPLRDGGPATDPSAGDRVRAGVGSVAVPDGWSTRVGAGIPGARLDDGVTATPAGRDSGSLAVGRTDAVGPTLLPTGFRARLAAPPARLDRVRLGEIAAYRYRALGVRGAPGPVTIFAVPTDGGVQTIACTAPAGRFAAFAPACEDAASTLRLSGAAAIPLGPSAEYAQALSAAIDGLNDEVPALRRDLAEAGSRVAQAEVAARLADRYAAAADGMAARRLGPEGAGLDEAVVAGLRDAAGAHDEMAGAARAGDPGAFAASRGAVADAHRDLRAALDALSSRGYVLASG